jgi:hypothetical protein
MVLFETPRSVSTTRNALMADNLSAQPTFYLSLSSRVKCNPLRLSRCVVWTTATRLIQIIHVPFPSNFIEDRRVIHASFSLESERKYGSNLDSNFSSCTLLSGGGSGCGSSFIILFVLVGIERLIALEVSTVF